MGSICFVNELYNCNGHPNSTVEFVVFVVVVFVVDGDIVPNDRME
jgi:hypothetical protein